MPQVRNTLEAVIWRSDTSRDRIPSDSEQPVVFEDTTEVRAEKERQRHTDTQTDRHTHRHIQRRTEGNKDQKEGWVTNKEKREYDRQEGAKEGQPMTLRQSTDMTTWNT